MVLSDYFIERTEGYLKYSQWEYPASAQGWSPGSSGKKSGSTNHYTAVYRGNTKAINP